MWENNDAAEAYKEQGGRGTGRIKEEPETLQ